MQTITLFHHYFTTSAFSGAAKVFTAFCAVASVWLINAIAGKSAFGAIILAYSQNYILAIGLAALFRNIVLFHVSRDYTAGNPDATRPTSDTSHSDKLATGMMLGVGAAFLLAAAEMYYAPVIAAAINQPGSSQWLAILAWMLPGFVANSLLNNWYRARRQVMTYVLYTEFLPPLIRVTALACIWYFSLAAAGVGYAYIASFTLPFLWLYLRNRPALHPRWRALSRRDLAYGAKSMLTQILARATTSIIFLAFGVFAPAAAVGELVIAERVSQFLMLGTRALAQLQVPRLGGFFREGDFAGLMREFNLLRSIAMGVTLLGTAALLPVLEYILPVFGDYASAYTATALFSVASIVRAGAGAQNNYLYMAGYAGYAMLGQIMALLCLLGGIAGLAPVYGINGAAGAFLGMTSCRLVCNTLIIWYLDHLWLLPLSVTMAVIASGTAIGLHLAGWIVIWPVCAVLMICAGVLLWCQHDVRRFFTGFFGGDDVG